MGALFERAPEPLAEPEAGKTANGEPAGLRWSSGALVTLIPPLLFGAGTV